MIKMVDEQATKTAVSENIRRLLRQHGWTQGELIRRIFGDVTQGRRQTVSRWCRGESPPSAADLLNLAEAFGVTAEEIGRPKKLKKTG